MQNSINRALYNQIPRMFNKIKNYKPLHKNINIVTKNYSLNGSRANKNLHWMSNTDSYYHSKKEGEKPMSLIRNTYATHWLDTEIAHDAVMLAKMTGEINLEDLVRIRSPSCNKPEPSIYFKDGLLEMGEHAISYMERLNEFKIFYENLPVENIPRFINLTIGGVYRDTLPRTDADAPRGYVTHLTQRDKSQVAKIFNRLGIDLDETQVGISPLRSKIALQHALGLFKRGIVVAHTPNYKSSLDAAKNDHGHTVIEVDVRGRYSALFQEVRRQTELPQHKNNNTPIILLLVCPQNPCAIAMNDVEEKELHSLIEDTGCHVIHDIAYQGYTKYPRDIGKRYRDQGTPHEGQVYMAFMSTSKSMYASGQPALYTADCNTLPFLADQYRRMATGPTSTFIHDLEYYYNTLDDSYMISVEDKLQKPILAFIDKHKKRWGVDYLIRPDGPPFITLDISNKLKELGINSKGFRELSLRLGSPVLVNEGVLRIALTGFDKKEHDAILPDILLRIDNMLSITADDSILLTFIYENPLYSYKN